MRSKCFGLFVAAAVAVTVCSPVVSAPFEPLVVAGKMTGQCTVLTPGAAAPVAVETGKAYLYGSALATGGGASLQVILSSGNDCLLSGEGTIVATEDKQNPTRKLITVGSGKLDVSLDPTFTDINALDIAGTCMRASITKGGKLSFNGFSEGALQVFVITCGDAVAQVSGPQFSIALLDKDDVLSASCSPDLTFIRLKAVKGAFEIAVQDAEGAAKLVPMESGSVVKILQKRSEVENTVVVTLLIIGADESVKEAITYSVKADSTAPIAETVVASVQETPKTAKKEPKKEPKKLEDTKIEKTEKPAKTGGETGEWTPMWPSAMTTDTQDGETVVTTTDEDGKPVVTTFIPPRDADAAAYRFNASVYASRSFRQAQSGQAASDIQDITQPINPTPVGLR